MRAFLRALRIISAVILFFFCWTYMPLYAAVAYAATPQGQGAGVKGQKQQGQGSSSKGQERPEERFEKALENIREKVGEAEEKLALSEVEGAGRGEAAAGEIEAIKVKSAEIEKLDIELKKEFSATEKKLKDAKLPKEILDRHYKFVKHYEDNLNELKTNLSFIEKPSAKSQELRAALQKAKAHLEKVKPLKKHIPLDPNKLPNRMVKAKARAPRLKKEDFEKDCPPHKKGSKLASLQAILAATELEWARIKHKPVLLAFNGPTSDIPFQLPLPSENNHPLPVAGEVCPELVERGWGEGAIPSFDTLSATNYEPRAILLAQAIVDSPTSDDLAETPEVQFSPELQEIATLLEHNPVQLYEFVRNNFSYDPYYGSVKGSQGTLLLQSGNDFDQASVLIALFRVSGIPARYAYGTVEIPIEKVMKWLGGITDPRTAGTVLATNGIPAKLIIAGSAVKSVQIEHVWTEVYIPYANYRGKINDPTAPKTWIPLDPSYKLIEPNPDILDLADAQQFNTDNYLSSYLQTVMPKTPAKDYLKNSIDYVTANIPGKRFYDLLVSNTIVDKVLDLLPDTLSYPIKTIGAKFSAIPDNYRHRITLEFTNSSNDPVLNYTTAWTMVLHNRFTLSYVPATTTDEQIIANYGDIYSTPSYLIAVKPVLKVEGVTVAEGAVVPMASDLTCRMNFIWPDGTVDKAVTNILVAGATYAIGLGSGYTTGRIVTNRTAKLEAAVNAGQTGEPIIGEYLNLFAVNYLQELDSSRKLIAKSMKTLDTNRAAELMVGVDLGVSAVFGIPKSVDIRGVLIDVDYNISTSVNIDDDQAKVRRFQILTGMTASALEHTMFESIIGVEAISTIKALEIANVQGIPVHQINSSNVSAKLPLLQLSSEATTDIQNAVNAGKVVTVSERNIQLNSWSGAGYIVMDQTTGAGAYMISGGLSGGSLTWVTRDLQWLVSSKQMTSTEAKKWILAHKKMIWFYPPVYGPVTGEFGEDRGDHKHSGIDIKVDPGTHVYAVAGGTVKRSYYREDYGQVIYIDHGAGVETIYGHNSVLHAPVGGAHVSEFDFIAESGSSGRSSGPHVHFEVRIGGVPVNPHDFSFQL